MKIKIIILTILFSVGITQLVSASEVDSKTSTVSITFVENPNTELYVEDLSINSEDKKQRLRVSNNSKLYIKSLESQEVSLDTENDSIKDLGNNKFQLVKEVLQYKLGDTYQEVGLGILEYKQPLEVLVVNAP